MFDVLLKHTLYEKAINILFERITLNFTKVFPMPNKGDTIEIRFIKKDGTKVWAKDALVHNTSDAFIIILYTVYNTEKAETFTIPGSDNVITTMPLITKTLDIVFKENITSWKPAQTKFSIRDTLYQESFNTPLPKPMPSKTVK